MKKLILVLFSILFATTVFATPFTHGPFGPRPYTGTLTGSDSSKLGIWSPTESYVVDDMVAWQGSIFYALQPSVNQQPDLSPLYWEYYPISDVSLLNIPVATYLTVQDWLNNTQSAGYMSGGGFTDNGDGTLTVAAGTGFIKSTNNGLSNTYSFDWAEDSALALAEGLNYIGVEYNAGAPQVFAEATKTSDSRTSFYLGKAFKEGTDLHILEAGMDLTEVISRIQGHLARKDGEIVYTGGLKVSETGNRYLAVESGTVDVGLTPISISAIDTSGADTFEYYYYDGAAWQESDVSQIDNANYNDTSSGLVALTPNRYGVHWIYIANDGELLVLYGQGDYILSEAEDALPPSSLPDHVSEFALLAAKIIVQEGATNFLSVESAFESQFSPSLATDHADLITLAWSSAGHTGTVSTFAGFDGTGAATYYPESNYLLAAGTRALTGDWDAGAYEIRAETFESDVATGTAPMTIASTTEVSNLHSDTATSLHANGTNCSSGSAPLGVDASGNAESCFDVWTEAENTSAAYISASSSDTLTNKIIDADDNTMQDFPYDVAWSLVDPSDDDIHYVRLQRALTLSSIGCIVDPEGSSESVVLDIQECDSNGDNCASALSSTITCGNTPTAGTVSDGAWDASDFIKIDIGTVTGTVKTLSIYGVGKESY